MGRGRDGARGCDRVSRVSLASTPSSTASSRRLSPLARLTPLLLLGDDTYTVMFLPTFSPLHASEPALRMRC